MQWSHSRVECFEGCAYKYKLRYLDQLLTLPPDQPDNALIVGIAMHTGLQFGAEKAIEEYFMSYPVITDEHINESIKLEYLIPEAKKLLPESKKMIFEKLISTFDFKGYADLLIPVGEYNEYDLFDFKYSNNGLKYRDSPQLHIYKHFLEQQGIKIRNMYYLIVPKVKIKQKKDEGLEQFRARIMTELQTVEPLLMKIPFNYQKVVTFALAIKRIQETTEFPQNISYLCNWCEYKQLCEKGEDYMILPKNERRNIEKVSKRTLWLYGAPFSGKTTFANKFDSPLMLNTDGNIKFVDAPVIPVRDEVTVEGRITKRILAWEIFKEAIDELEKKQNEFKTIIIDLLEDLYDHCRLYMYREMGITHESDDSFRAWDKVTMEFLSTLKRAMNMDYENIILLSHEDTSKDITKKSGDKITAIKPNMREKVANKIAGMVDIVARVVAEGESHTLSFKTSEVVFGGGRLMFETNEIPLDVDELLKVYEEANKNAGKTPQTKRKDTPESKDTPVEENAPDTANNPPDEAIEDKPKEPPPVRSRKRRES